MSDMPAATISYMPAGGTSDRSMCDWTVQCAAGQTVSLTFVQFETEARRDTVNLYDGTAESDAKIRGGNLSGDMASLPTTQFSSTGPAMMLAFTSDGSGGPAAGFEAMYECVGADSSPPPPPPPTELPVDGTFVDGVVHEEGDEAVFQFTAQQGQTYQVETEQCVSSGEGPVCLYGLGGYKVWLGSVWSDGRRIVSDGRDNAIVTHDFSGEAEEAVDEASS